MPVCCATAPLGCHAPDTTGAAYTNTDLHSFVLHLQLAGQNGIGRIDIVESRFVGMKSRGVYETPGGTILLAARRALESITLDRGEAHLKDELMPRYAELVYNGFWFSPERLALQAAIDQTQKYATGTVRLKLYKARRLRKPSMQSGSATR